MKVFIIRHGEAEPRRDTDAGRNLTARGRADALALGKMLERDKLQIHTAIVSPYQRARQTLECLLEGARLQPRVHVAEHITPEDAVNSAYEELEPFGGCESLVIVSHMPLVSSLIASLVDGTERTASHYPMSTASMAELDVDMLAPCGARLKRLLSPPYA